MTRRHLSLLAAGATAAGAFAAVAGLADAAGEHDGPSRLDPMIAGEVLELRTPALTGAAHAFTFAGSEVVVGGVALLILVGLLLRGRLTQAATLAVGLAGSAALTVAVKWWVARPRPGTVDRLGAPDTSYSFPSGHTLNFLVLLLLVLGLWWPTARGTARTALVGFTFVAAVGVGASRVYLGYHWLTDVVASGLVAVGWLSILWCLRRPLARTVEHVDPRRS